MAIQRVKPLTVRDVERRWMVAHGTGDTALAVQEIVTTSDQKRLWRGDGTLLSGGVDHGTVATEAALATIYLLPSCTRGVWPNDTAFVAASGCEYRCISGSNATAVWRAVGAGVSAGTTAAWGGITGDIASQTDLADALAGKQPSSASLDDLSTLSADERGRLDTLVVAAPSVAGLALLRIAPAAAQKIPQINTDGSVTLVDPPSGGSISGHHYLSLDWATRCAALGSYPAEATLTALDAFFAALASAGILSSMLRVNLFCGPDLVACRVPQLKYAGAATDTATGFVAADYAESSGLQGASTKRLATGLNGSACAENSLHLSVYSRTNDTAAVSEIGCWANVSSRVVLACSYSGTSLVDIYQVTSGGRAATTGQRSDGFWCGSRTSASNLFLQRNGSTVATNTGTSIGSRPGTQFYVFDDGQLTSSSTRQLAGYTIGLGLTESQAQALNTAMQAFQSALGRAV